ncbi:hypothetical protein [Tateyamaria pelophila]|uniref:hypothetical protein n=1 Tax=Tateyamaria pelophila TaxID=328415 RepID=UPI001CBF42AC|nr:hypothetical protein [Tateyamaria pelophila]
MPDPGPVTGLQEFFHVRIIIGLVTGLSVTRILTGLARFVQSPDRNRIYAPHLAWSGFLLLYVIHFWWLEFGLMFVPRWQFQNFLFIIGYAALIFFTAALLFPDQMEDSPSFSDYFHSRRSWFYGLLLAILAVDLADNSFHNAAHLKLLGWTYAARQTALIAFALIGLMSRRTGVHFGLALSAIFVELLWIVMRYRFLD